MCSRMFRGLVFLSVMLASSIGAKVGLAGDIFFVMPLESISSSRSEESARNMAYFAIGEEISDHYDYLKTLWTNVELVDFGYNLDVQYNPTRERYYAYVDGYVVFKVSGAKLNRPNPPVPVGESTP